MQRGYLSYPLYTLCAGDARVDLAVSLLAGWHLRVLCCGRTLQLQQTDLESWVLEASACSEGLCGRIILLRFSREKWMLLHTAAVGFTSENKWERLPNPGCSKVPWVAGTSVPEVFFES